MTGFAPASDLVASAASSMIWPGPMSRRRAWNQPMRTWRARKAREAEALQWSEGLIGDVADEPR